MDRITVELLSHSPIYNSIVGARTCWDSFHKDDYKNEDNIGENNKGLLRKLIYGCKHYSVIEHTYYTFRIRGASRLMLQELTRHRIASYSVQSTRYTLKKLLKEDIDKINMLDKPEEWHYGDEVVEYHSLVKKYLVVPENFDGEDYYDMFQQLKTLVRKLQKYNNDEVKYFLPESWRTEIIWTINARSLRNFLHLRYSKNAHFEIRRAAELVLNVLPKRHLILFEDIRG